MRLSPESGFNFHFFAESGFVSILGSLLEVFWEESSSLYAFLVARGAQSVVFFGTLFSIDFFMDFRVRPGGPRGWEP